MSGKENFPPSENPTLNPDSWLVSDYSFGNGFWQDKEQSFNHTYVDGQGERICLRSGYWYLKHHGQIIATATECVLADTGPIWLKIDIDPHINPAQKQTLEASLEYYGAIRDK